MSPAMSQNYVHQFPVENFSLNSIQLTLLIVGLVEFFLLHLLTYRKTIHNFFFGFNPSIQPKLISSIEPKEKSVDQSVSRGEVQIVLRSLGMCCSSEEAKKLPARLDADNLFNLFEENNPSLDEVKEAFDVFDENRDGFIDAKELQKVLSALGLKEGLEMDNCRRMIGMFDENEDGRIDFDEFVKFMESSLC